MKKPIYKKWWVWVIAFFAVLTVYGAITGVNQAKDQIAEEETNKEDIEVDEEKQEEEVEKEVPEPEEETEDSGIIEVDEQLTFAEFTVDFEQVEIEDDKAVITFKWLNQAGDGKQFFFALSGIDVAQSDDILDETSGAYDAENKNTSDIYFPNAENGETKVTLEYELKDKETPIDITFVPYNDYGEDSQKVTIEID